MRSIIVEIGMWQLWFILGLISSSGHAEIYKRVDQEGHITYSSTPSKGAVRLFLEPVPVAPEPIRPRPSVTPHASPSNFPKVDASTQRTRDDWRRKILQDELSSEEQLLQAAQHARQGADAVVHQRNIDALKAELARLK